MRRTAMPEALHDPGLARIPDLRGGWRAIVHRLAPRFKHPVLLVDAAGRVFKREEE